MVQPVIVWFRDDLRLSDNLALWRAADSGAPMVCVYVLDEGSVSLRPLGGASRWWLHHSLVALSGELARRGAELFVLRGPTEPVIRGLFDALKPGAVFWNRRYEPHAVALDARLKAKAAAQAIRAESFNAALLHEPWEVIGKSGDPPRVFSPFWRAALARGEPAAPLPAPATLKGWSREVPGQVALAELDLLPTRPDWSSGLKSTFSPGEAGAGHQLDAFMAGGVKGYAEDRDRPDMASTSALSPHLRFGEISPRQIWHRLDQAREAGTTRARAKDIDKFKSELGWREFSYSLMFHNVDLAQKNLQRRFDAFPWRDDPVALSAWQRGRTGYPIVDAGMRQLWQTGWMHNRVRMVVASFLVKHLLIGWQAGEAWFWDTLVDADPASNAASWQWVAGSGADAAPYFRIFNPVLQGERFDPQGDYVRRFVPELAGLDAGVIHKPWTAKPRELAAAGVELGLTYPPPMVDHDWARQRALAAFDSLKSDPPARP
jgi:deoxyribodipyrimidine photo-lyase